MLKYVTLIALVFSQSVAFGRSFGVGLGFETRAQQDVNPAMYEAQMIGLGSLQFKAWPWTMALESGYESSESNSGALSIQSRSISLMGWGRREFRPARSWSPFIAAGAGVFFDRVISTYLGSRDQRQGNRAALGVGAGLTRLFSNGVFVEAEGRSHAVEDRMDLSFSAIVRVGFLFDQAGENSAGPVVQTF